MKNFILLFSLVFIPFLNLFGQNIETIVQYEFNGMDSIPVFIKHLNYCQKDTSIFIEGTTAINKTNDLIIDTTFYWINNSWKLGFVTNYYYKDLDWSGENWHEHLLAISITDYFIEGISRFPRIKKVFVYRYYGITNIRFWGGNTNYSNTNWIDLYKWIHWDYTVVNQALEHKYIYNYGYGYDYQFHYFSSYDKVDGIRITRDNDEYWKKHVQLTYNGNGQVELEKNTISLRDSVYWSLWHDYETQITYKYNGNDTILIQKDSLINQVLTNIYRDTIIYKPAFKLKVSFIDEKIRLKTYSYYKRIPTQIKLDFEKKDFEIKYNPHTRNIVFPESHFVIYTIDGKKISSGYDNQTRFQYNPGVYIIVLKNNGKQYSKKILIN
jgi:hypothetical protein